MKAYEKLISDIQKDLKQLELEIDAIPDINSLNLLFNFLQYYFFNSTRIKELYSRLDKLRAKAQNGLDYYEMATMKQTIEKKSDQEVNNNREEYKVSSDQESNIAQDVGGSQITSNGRESCVNGEMSSNQINSSHQKSYFNQDTETEQESSTEESYFSQLIDLLADITFLEKRLRKKDTQSFSFG
ncbi:hypothetical protein BC008_15420 [Mastigocoleus testarum BC008]|uniref:Uncharacterized protein n=2 Tax=Mastigocoleus TaxID=996924 RepID=A0A0V7ZH11_9CYAN|nr:hypothetical protein BC008_15420 [Mastigocoleus testarum BC008]